MVADGDNVPEVDAPPPQSALDAARAALAAAEARRAMAEAMKRLQAQPPKSGSGVHKVPASSSDGASGEAPSLRHDDRPRSAAHKLPASPAAAGSDERSRSGVHKVQPPDERRSEQPKGKPPSSGSHRALGAQPSSPPPPKSGPHARPPQRPSGAGSGEGPGLRSSGSGEGPGLRSPARPAGQSHGAPRPAGPHPGAPGARPAPKPATPPAKAVRPGVTQRRVDSDGKALPPVGPTSASGARRPGPPGRPGQPGRPPARPGAPPAAAAQRATPAAAPVAAKASSAKGQLPTGGRKRLRRFEDLGWRCAEPKEGDAAAAAAVKAIAVDVGVEGLCVTSFEGSFNRARDQAQPTMAMITDPHAFRTMERKSLEYGVPAWTRWPSERVMRGTDGTILIPSQIGLVSFPADHVLSAMLLKVRDERRKGPKELVLTLPTFLASDRDDTLRAAVAPWKKGSFRGVPAAIGASYFYLAPALDRVEGGPVDDIPRWAREALAQGRVLLLGWGASGLEYGLVTVRGSSAGASSSSSGSGGLTTELRLLLAGTWPSLGGHRLTASILVDLKELLTDRILAAGPSDALLSRALIAHGDKLDGRVPFPVGYEDAFRRLTRLAEMAAAGSLEPYEEDERRRLRNVLFPTAWRFGKGEEPPGYAPYRRLAVAHFKALWDEAEKIKRMIFSDPAKYRQRRSITWNLETFESPFASHLDDRTIPYPVAPFLARVEHGLQACLQHVDRRLAVRGIKPSVHVALIGMQSCSPLLPDALRAHAATPGARALAGAKVCPTSSDPLEQKAVTNRGAALLNRDKRHLDFGPVPDVLPFSVQIADCLGNIDIFHPGVVDELVVFQRRFQVEGGLPQLEFYIYESEDGTQRGNWGAIDFSRPFEFTERDRVFGVDPRYGFGGEVPRLSELRGDGGAELAQRCFDRGSGSADGLISFRSYAPRESEKARQLLHFLEYGLTGEFHRKVYLLEREFAPPPRRVGPVYQRYYLSRSQELIVVREWWTPFEGDKVVRNKTLHTCQGTTTANAILGLEWGRF